MKETVARPAWKVRYDRYTRRWVVYRRTSGALGRVVGLEWVEVGRRATWEEAIFWLRCTLLPVFEKPNDVESEEKK